MRPPDSVPSFLVVFSRSDAQPGGELLHELRCDGFVQLTYDNLRFGPDGDTVAVYDSVSGEWQIALAYSKFGGEGEVDEWYTDVTVTLDPVTEPPRRGLDDPYVTDEGHEVYYSLTHRSWAVRWTADDGEPYSKNIGIAEAARLISHKDGMVRS